MKKLFLALLFLFSLTYSAFGAEGKINLKGFLTFVYAQTNSSVEYVDDLNKDGDFITGTKGGLQFYSTVNSKMDAYLQLLVDGEEGSDFDVDLDLAHINLRFDDRNEFTIGKVRIPVWLVSDYMQVGSLYPWIRLPDEIYKIAPLDSLGAHHTFIGGMYSRTLMQSDDYKITSEIYTGGSEKESPARGGGGRTEISAKLHGVTLQFEFNDFYAKASYLNVHSKGERYDIFSDGNLPERKFRTEYVNLGLKYDNGSILSLTEYSLIDGQTFDISHIKSYYTLIGKYLFDQDYLVHLTAGHVDESSNSNFDISQSSLSLGLNYFYDLSTVFKAEWQNVFLDSQSTTPNRPSGLFRRYPGDKVQIYSVSINTMF